MAAPIDTGLAVKIKQERDLGPSTGDLSTRATQLCRQPLVGYRHNFPDLDRECAHAWPFPTLLLSISHIIAVAKSHGIALARGPD